MFKQSFIVALKALCVKVAVLGGMPAISKAHLLCTHSFVRC